MKGKILALTAFAAAAFAAGDSPASESPSILRKDKDIDFTPKTPPTPKGLKKYSFYGFEVWAINEKNAKRKAEKLLNQQK